ncbi:putative multidrug resistance protein [Miscanthus floridulus]|uniref:putative multidrug resistance protein n=1 Tax=Miscanthus floridulus TaxID=154761 RepID=UPI00345A9B7A
MHAEGYCWARTAERQASRMRERYLRTVLRQAMEYFDLKVGSTSEVITSVSNDSLVVQDVLREKVPNFVMNCSMFLGSYAVAFALLWHLTLVALPSVLLLITPGFMYGRILIGLARQIREQYTRGRPGAIAEQAVSSVRTVYSFVAESSTMVQFSAALEESARLGIKQGLAKGVAIGSNGITFTIWAFNVWYGSRLVMYHGYQGGTVFAVSAAIVVGGLTLGSGLLNVKYFSEASSAAERVQEVIQRVPKIDSESSAGDELANVAGEVTLDGVDIRRLRLKWLHAQMGLVSQEPALFATSIRENILFGKEDATEEEVVANKIMQIKLNVLALY